MVSQMNGKVAIISILHITVFYNHIKVEGTSGWDVWWPPSLEIGNQTLDDFFGRYGVFVSHVRAKSWIK